MTMNSPRTYLLSQSQLDRHAYTLLLRLELGLEVTIASDFVPTAVWDALRQKPEIVLVVCDAPSPAALDAVRMIPRLSPEARILVISAAVEPNLLSGWAECKLQGYVVKDGGLPELRNAVEALAVGREFYSAGVRSALTSRQLGNGVVKLSRRETELLPLIARGMTLRDAARQMTVSYKTAESYRTSLMRKLGVRDRVELARYAIRQRIVDP